MINIKCTGDFKNTTKFLEQNKKMSLENILHRYGKEGVKVLSAATPVDTGNTASRWSYKISYGKGGPSISWINDADTSSGVPIVILLQYGHGTKNGGYVSGVDFINPTIKPIMDGIADSIWKEVTK